MIVGLSGYAGAGKDEAAKALVNEWGFTRIAFADVLREMAYAIDPFVYWFNRFRRLEEIIDQHGWDYAKNNSDDVRRLLQRLGTEAGRNILGDNIWVDTALARAHDDIVVTDMRFPNELQAVEERDGITLRIERPGVGPRNNHASETSLTDHSLFRYVINNDGSIDDLHRNVLETVREDYEAEQEARATLQRLKEQR